MELQHLRTFVEVVRQGGFAAAARRLDLSPSKVTRAVAALEASLGTRLLARTSRRIALTDAGSGYLARVAPLIESLDQASDELRTGAQAARGTVRMTASVAYGEAVLVPMLGALHRAHPGLEVELMLSDARLDLVAQRIDVALRLGGSVDPSLIGRRLAPVRHRVCASPSWLKAHRAPRTPADLAELPCLRMTLPGYRSRWTFRPRGGRTTSVAVGGWLLTSSALALRRAALDGLGPALLADWLVGEDLRRGRLVDLFVDHEVSATGFDEAVWLVYTSRDLIPRRVRAFIDFVVARFG